MGSTSKYSPSPRNLSSVVSNAFSQQICSPSKSGSGDNSGGVINNIVRHREELHLIAVVIPTWVYAILWRSSFVYTSALIRKSCNHNSHRTQDYQSHSTRSYKQRKTPTSEHSGVITLRALILAPPRGDDIYISFSYYFCIFFRSPPEFTTEPKMPFTPSKLRFLRLCQPKTTSLYSTSQNGDDKFTF